MTTQNRAAPDISSMIAGATVSKTVGICFDVIESLAAKIAAGEQVDTRIISPAALPSSIPAAELLATLSKIKTGFHNIIKTYISLDSPKEINLPSKTKKRVLDEFEAGNYCPDVFVDAVAHIINMLRTGPFVKYLAYLAKNPQSQKTSVASQASKLSERMPSSLPGSANPSPIGSPSIPGGVKVTIRVVISNVLPPPYSNKDFLDFLKKERAAEGLEFINAVDDYRMLAQFLYPTQSSYVASADQCKVSGQFSQRMRPAGAADSVSTTTSSLLADVPFTKLERTANEMKSVDLLVNADPSLVQALKTIDMAPSELAEKLAQIRLS
eukprot:jgi/Hompol1/3742/HPOL_006713-RA